MMSYCSSGHCITSEPERARQTNAQQGTLTLGARTGIKANSLKKCVVRNTRERVITSQSYNTRDGKRKPNRRSAHERVSVSIRPETISREDVCPGYVLSHSPSMIGHCYQQMSLQGPALDVSAPQGADCTSRSSYCVAASSEKHLGKKYAAIFAQPSAPETDEMANAVCRLQSPAFALESPAKMQLGYAAATINRLKSC